MKDKTVSENKPKIVNVKKNKTKMCHKGNNLAKGLPGS